MRALVGASVCYILQGDYASPKSCLDGKKLPVIYANHCSLPIGVGGSSKVD